MITVMLYKKADRFTGFYSYGHADYADAGEDIVCAAVSVLTQTLIASLEKLLAAGASLKYGMKKGEENGLYLELPEELRAEDRKISETLFQSMQIGLEMIQKQYPENVSILISPNGR